MRLIAKKAIRMLHISHLNFITTDLQELSYLKQIARQLRTQYVEARGHSPNYPVTLKSRLRVTQGHWKRKHWMDHTHSLTHCCA